MKRFISFHTADGISSWFLDAEEYNPEDPIPEEVKRGVGGPVDFTTNSNGGCVLTYKNYRTYKHTRTTIEYFDGERVAWSNYHEVLDT